MIGAVVRPGCYRRRMRWARLAPCLVAAFVGVPTAARAAPLELTPAGEEQCCFPSDYSIRGYRFTANEAFTAYGIEWWVEVPAGAMIAARVRDPEGALLLEGEPTVGDGVDGWIVMASRTRACNATASFAPAHRRGHDRSPLAAIAGPQPLPFDARSTSASAPAKKPGPPPARSPRRRCA